MRVIGVRVQEEMTGSQLAIANSCELSGNTQVTHFVLVYMCRYK